MSNITIVVRNYQNEIQVSNMKQETTIRISVKCYHCCLILNRETTNNPSIINIDGFNNRFKKERKNIKKENTARQIFSIFVAFVVVVFVVIPLQGSSTFKMRQYN